MSSTTTGVCVVPVGSTSGADTSTSAIAAPGLPHHHERRARTIRHVLHPLRAFLVGPDDAPDGRRARQSTPPGPAPRARRGSARA